MKTKEVTSHVEVWIETVDTTKIKPAEQGHLPRGGVDWNYNIRKYFNKKVVTSHVEVWIETYLL